MQLLIDAGNTRIKWVLLQRGEWVRSGNLPTVQADELPALFAAQAGLRQIWVSNVAGASVARHIRDIPVPGCGAPHFISARASQCGVHNGYEIPEQLGSDRWAALLAAWDMIGASCLVVGCGTAITIDALDGSGRFPGGLILPGLELMRHSLDDATAQLQTADGSYAAFPRNTADAMFSGSLQAACGAVMRQHALLGDAAAPVLLGGGAAGLLCEHLNLPVRLVDNPVLHGLSLIARDEGA